MPDGRLTDRDRLHVAAFSAFYNASPELPPCERLMQAVVKSSDKALGNVLACPLLLLAWELKEKRRGVSGAKHGDVGRNPLIEAEIAARVKRYRREAARHLGYVRDFGEEQMRGRALWFMPTTTSLTQGHREAVA